MNDAPIGNSEFFDSSTVSKLEELSDEEFWNYARELAGITYQAPQHQEYLECELASGPCLIPLAELDEVVLPPHRLTLLPATPDWMRGIIAWRGETIAVIDLDAYLSGSSDMLITCPPDRVLSSEGTILVTDVGDVPVGLLVPKVGETKPISSTTPTQAFAWYMPGRAKDIKDVYAETRVLDLDALLTHVVQQIGMPSHNG
jgi:chemotaxis signal transduction protein